MRVLWFFCSAILLSSCTSYNTEESATSSFVKSVGSLIGGVEFTEEEALALKYATLVVSIDGDSNISMPLGYLEEDQQKWFSKDLFSLQTQNGRIIRLLNTPHDADLEIVDNDALRHWSWKRFLQSPNGDEQVLRSLQINIDYLNRRHFGVPATLNLISEGLEERRHLGRNVRLMRVRESLNVPALNYFHNNFYWIDPESGFVWQSMQKWGPDSPEFYYEVVKPWMIVKEPAV